MSDSGTHPSSTKIGPSNGISGGYQGDNKIILASMTAFTAVALYNAVEIIVLIFVVFKKYTGLYFWSLFITTASVIPYQLGAWMKQNRLVDEAEMLTVSLSSLGWFIMVPGQSLVLYSRLHLVTQNERLLKFIFWGIIINAVVLCIPTIVLTYGSNTAAKHIYLPPYAVLEKVQMTIFSIQEFFISGVYLWEVRNILSVVFEGGTRNLMWQLFILNIFIIFLDVALLAVEFCNFYQIQTTLKGMVYSIKLKIEFGVLSKLVKVVTSKSDKNRVASRRPSGPKGSKESLDLESLPSHHTGISSYVYMPKSSSHLLKNSTRTQHYEYSVADESLPPDWNLPTDWRMGSELAQSQQPALVEEITEFKQRRSRRSSITELYPGRLGPRLGELKTEEPKSGG
ncbi:hypothetical protein EJ08DRAFT_650867 [Tothia fuscella]|uniref:DUF7703 domain-containing protein n=1 Tax=Tothia fuscella TaxID=1048955 RepID=A0A9P4NN63_9PEZI|nr:hypothetical protein EJ08DRAFT_650867 [Tothia fuscella]